jgi:heme-degrading monooxygenase HmoA
MLSQTTPQWNMSLVPHVLIIHEVEDYPAWKRVFDDASDIRRMAGERSYQVLKYQSDPNRIVHFSAWTSIDDARRFFESPELVRIRAEAGVKSPAFVYLEQIEAGVL